MHGAKHVFPKQPGVPLLPADIIKRRPASGTVQPVFGFPTPSPTALFTLGPPPKKVLTIVSWNVQTFFDTKAEANPYVNFIINAILEELEVDVCLLLETRDNVAVNLSAIENKLANPSSFKSDETTEDQWDQKALDQEAVDHIKNVEALACKPVSFEMIASEITGKRFKAPERVYLFGNKDKFFPCLLKPQCLDGKKYNGRWKTTYLENKVLRAYYEPFSLKNKTPIADIRIVPLTEEAEEDVYFSLKACSVCGERLGKTSDCYACVDFGPFSTALENLRQELLFISFSPSQKASAMALETYGVLVRPHDPFVSGQLIQLKNKEARAFRSGCQLLRCTPPPNAPLSLQDRLNRYKFSKKLPPSASPQEVLKALKGDFNVRNIDSQTLEVNAKLTALGIASESYQVLSPEQRMQIFAETFNVVGDRGVALFDWVKSNGGDPQNLTVAAQLDFLKVPDRRGPFPLSTGERLQIFRHEGQVPDLTSDNDAIAQALIKANINGNSVVLEAGLDAVKVPRFSDSGDLLPYLNPKSNTYGRSPYVLPIRAILSGDTTETEIPVVGFHAPYGEDNDKGFQMRVDSLAQALGADVGSGVAFQAHPCAILMGDLNLDLTEPTSRAGGRYAQQGYEGLENAGFNYAIPKVPSSLTSYFNSKWKTQKKKDMYEDAPFLKKDGAVTNFTSSAYDNVCVKGAHLQSKIVTAAVIDVIGWIKAGLKSGLIPTTGAEKEYADFPKLTDDQKAFFIYRCFVSDHLPVIVDIEVEPLAVDYQLRSQSHVAIRKYDAFKESVRIVELSYSRRCWIDACPATGFTTIDSTRCVFGIGQLTNLDPQKGFVLATSKTVTTTFGVPTRVYGSPALNQPAAVVFMKQTEDDKAYVHALIDCANTNEVVVPIDQSKSSVFLIGRVTVISQDRLRFRVVAGIYRCTLAVPDEWDDAPPIGAYIIAVLEGCGETPMVLVKKV